MTLTVSGTGVSTAYSGVLSGSGNLILNGSGGSLRLSNANTYGGYTTINAGTLRLATNVPVVDGSFANATGLTSDNSNYRALDSGGVGQNQLWTPPGSSWTFMNHSGIATDGGGWGLPALNGLPGIQPNAKTGFYQSAVEQDYYYTPGNGYAYLAQTAAFETMNFPVAGTYSINFYAAYSTIANPSAESLSLYFGGNTRGGNLTPGILVGTITPASSTQWTAYSIPVSVPVAGSYQITFEMPVNYFTNAINAFTDVTQTLKTATPTLNIANADFTMSSGLANGNFGYNPSGASWTFVGQSGISANGSPFSDGSPSGFAGFIQNTGSISQAISFPTAGTYTLSFFTEGRGGGYGPNPFDVELGLNGANFANIPGIGTNGLVTPNGTSSYNLVTGTFTITTPGSYTLDFVGTNDPNVSEQDLTSTITDVGIALPGSGILPATTPLTVASGAYFDLGGLSNQTVASLSGGGTVINSGASASILTVAPPSGASPFTFSGSIQDGSTQGGTGRVGLTLNGDPSAMLTLSGPNTYTGGTMVTSGTLRSHRLVGLYR